MGEDLCFTQWLWEFSIEYILIGSKRRLCLLPVPFASLSRGVPFACCFLQGSFSIPRVDSAVERKQEISQSTLGRSPVLARISKHELENRLDFRFGDGRVSLTIIRLCGCWLVMNNGR